jgi:hypothetical protein
MNPEDLLTDALRDRTERTAYPSTPITAVAVRARAVRARRRRTTALAAAAAVAAVVAPTAFWLNRSPSASPSPSHELSSGPTSSPTVSTSEPPIMALLALPKGPEPDVDYLDGDTFVGISGEHLAVPPGTDAVARARGGGLLVATADRSGGPVFVNGFAGRLALVDQKPDHTGHQDLGCGVMQFAFSADGTQAGYWVMTSCDPTRGGTLYLGSLSTMGESGPAGVPTAPGQVDIPVGVLPGDDAVVNAVKPDGSSDGVWVIGSGAPQRIPGLENAEGVSESTGAVSGTTHDGTSVVVDASSGSVQWSAPDGWVLGKFSLDGEHVVAARSVGSTTRYSILDAATGHSVTDVPAVVGTEVIETAWAEDGSLMLVLDDHQESAIVRCTLAGQLTRATPVASDGDVAHYRFGTTP